MTGPAPPPGGASTAKVTRQDGCTPNLRAGTRSLQGQLQADNRPGAQRNFRLASSRSGTLTKGICVGRKVALRHLTKFFGRPLRQFLAAALAAVALGPLSGSAFADAVGPAGEGAAAPAVRTARGWAAMSGSDLKGTLDGWSRAAGWTLVWDSQVNYRLRASAQFAGDFETAVASLVDTIHRSNPEVLVTLYRGNRVVHVETTLVETR